MITLRLDSHDEPSEHGNGDDAGKVGSRFERLRDRHALADSLIGARPIEVAKAVLAEHSLEVALVVSGNS